MISTLSGQMLRGLMLGIAVAAIGFIGCEARGRGHPAVGRGVGPLPVVSLGDPRATAPALTGKVTLLNFWGTWCPPCRRELPGLVRLATQLADEPRFQLVAVSCGMDDIEELAATTAAFLVEHKLPLRPWGFADPLARSRFATAYGLEAFPTTYLIGPDARVRQVWVGYRSRDEADIAQAVLRLLKEQALPAAIPPATTPADPLPADPAPPAAR
jgi:cytochrome c biogenesis protein CcmG, thiol:disulfide interchange protein DsbE